jgi:energy-coupling factor transport system permease protein
MQQEFSCGLDPVKFVMSLMQQLRLSPKLAYGVMVDISFTC